MITVHATIAERSYAVAERKEFASKNAKNSDFWPRYEERVSKHTTWHGRGATCQAFYTCAENAQRAVSWCNITVTRGVLGKVLLVKLKLKSTR